MRTNGRYMHKQYNIALRKESDMQTDTSCDGNRYDTIILAGHHARKGALSRQKIQKNNRKKNF